MNWIMKLLYLTFTLVLLAGCSSKGTELINRNANDAEVVASEEKKAEGKLENADPGQVPVVEVFGEECGCRAVYERMLNDGGQAPECVAANLIAADDSIPHGQIMKNPVPFYGRAAMFTGRLYQIREVPMRDGSRTEALMALKRGGAQLLHAYGAVSTPFVDGDRVTVVGYLAKHLHQYKSVAQWDVSVPLLIMRQMLKPDNALYLRVPVDGEPKPREMKFEISAYKKLFEQEVAFDRQISPDKPGGEIIVGALTRTRAATEQNGKHFERYREHLYVRMNKLVREGAEQRAQEMLAAEQQ